LKQICISVNVCIFFGLLPIETGGLSRFAQHGRITNNSSGGGVKDTWIVNLND